MKSMALTCAAVACAVATLTATGASADMAAVFSNTVVSQYPDGGWVKHWFNPDGTYVAEFSDGRRLAARWRVQGQQVCLTNIRPNMLIPRFCSAVVDANVGQSWQSRDPLGRRVRNTLVAGR